MKCGHLGRELELCLDLSNHEDRGGLGVIIRISGRIGVIIQILGRMGVIIQIMGRLGVIIQI